MDIKTAVEIDVLVPERNRLIVDTWLEYVKTKRTAVFCASVKHAKQIADLFREKGVTSFAVSGVMKASERKELQARFVTGEMKVLCACDLLNEVWDCPQTEVLFMSRHAYRRKQAIPNGLRLCRQCKPIQHAVFHAQAV